MVTVFAVASDGETVFIGDRFVGAGAVADEIVRRLVPTEISQEHGQQLREMAQYGSHYYSNALFGGPRAWILDTVINPDGALELSLRDSSGCRIWQTKLHPVA